jgi:uncharacterized protein YraI
MSISPKSFVVAIAAAISFPGLAAAQDVVAMTTLDLNLRAGPAPTFPVIAVIPANADVTLYGCVADRAWRDVGFEGQRGWSYAAYLMFQNAVIPQIEQGLPPPVEFQGEAYWAQNYPTQPFYNDRARFFGAAGGAAAGAMIGVLVGPIGAAIGAVVGGAFGAAVTPPDRVMVLIQTQPVPQQPLLLEGEVVLGATIPATVTLTPIPDYQYAYAHINGQWVLVDPQTRAIVYVVRG